MPASSRFSINLPMAIRRPEHVADLHVALGRLGASIDTSELDRRNLGPSTVAAIGDVQEKAGLPATGQLTPETIQFINAEAEHAFVARSKTRTARLQDLLERLGHPVDAAERKGRALGPSTMAALGAALSAVGMPADERITEAGLATLDAAALAKRFTSKRQISGLHRRLIHVARIAKLEAPIAREELRERSIGETTRAALRTFQEKYGLPATGELDPVTYERIESVAASRGRPVDALAVRRGETTGPVRRGLRLNKKGEPVAQLQRALARLGFAIDRSEHDAMTFGKATRNAVLAFQQQQGLSATGEVDSATKQQIDGALTIVSPGVASAGAGMYRLRGSVRDHRWMGRGGRVRSGKEVVVMASRNRSLW